MKVAWRDRDLRDPTRLGNLLLLAREVPDRLIMSLSAVYDSVELAVPDYEETALGPIEKYGRPQARPEGK